MAMLATSDARMLELIDILKEVNEIAFTTDFCRAAGVLKQNILTVRNGKTAFRAIAIERVCKHYNINANWIMGTEQNVFRGKQNRPALNKFITDLRKTLKKIPSAPKVRQKPPLLNK